MSAVNEAMNGRSDEKRKAGSDRSRGEKIGLL